MLLVYPMDKMVNETLNRTSQQSVLDKLFVMFNELVQLLSAQMVKLRGPDIDLLSGEHCNDASLNGDTDI